MSEFITDLDIRLVNESENLHRLLAPLAYKSDLLKEEIIVPIGFETDFASVPRLPLAYLIVGGRGARAAVIHDWLYKLRKTSRKMADEIFAEALKASGYNSFVVWLMYAGVRIGGGAYWREAPDAPDSIA